MWVRVQDWMLADNEPPNPEAGSVLRSVGVRVRGAVTAADNATPDGIATVTDAGPLGRVYGLTGIASEARDVQNGEGRDGKRPQPAGAEFVLTVGESRFQVQFDGHSREVQPNSRVRVIGDLGLVGGYEWEAFGLSDTRMDWMIIERVATSEDGVWLDLEPSGNVGLS